jgi:hypothetical protein
MFGKLVRLKVKISLAMKKYLVLKHHTVTTYGRVEAEVQAFSTSATDGSSCHLHAPTSPTP